MAPMQLTYLVGQGDMVRLVAAGGQVSVLVRLEPEGRREAV